MAVKAPAHGDSLPGRRDLAALGFALTLIVLIAGGALAYSNAQRLITNERWVAHDDAVALALANVLSTMKDAETGQRGYLITQDAQYLRPYDEAVGRVQTEVADLQELIVDPAQRARLAVLQQQIALKLGELKQTITLAKAGERAAALQIVRNNTGKALMDAVRTQVAAMQTTEYQLLDRRVHASELSFRAMLASILFPSVLGVVLLCFVFLGAKRNLSRHREFERQIAADLAAMSQLRDLGELCVRSGQELEQCIAEVLQTAIAIAEADRGNVQLLDPESGALRIAAQRGFEKPFLDFFASVNAGEAAACGAAMQATRRVVVEDIERSELFAGTPALQVLRDAGVRAVQSTPLVSSSGQVLGMVSTHFDQPRQLSDRQAQLLDLLARQCADYLERRQAAAGRQAAEQAMRASERLYRGIGESINYGVWVCDGEGENLYASEAFLRLTGLTLQQYCDPDWVRVVHPDDRERVATAWEECVRTGSNWYQEHRILGADGAYHPILAQGVPIRDESGRIDRWAGIHLDIKRLKVTEEALQEADRRKDEFLAMLAHELRNPLAPVGNAIELLTFIRSVREDARAQAAIAMARRQVKLLSRLVDDLLDVSRITRGNIELVRRPLELSNLISQAVETVEPLLREKQHKVSISTSNNQDLYVNADPVRLLQCVVNVLSNAARYTNPGGEIQVQARKDGTHAIIEIIDNGMGIAPDLLPHVFDLFVQGDRTLDRSQGGLGVGLSVVRRLLELHEGQVSARSAGLGHGSTFEIRLPLIKPPDTPVTEQQEFKSAPKRVLIVDDNCDAADSLALLLRLDGNEAQAVYTALEALARVRSFKPDVVLLDIGLPQIDGYELAKRLRAMPEMTAVRLIAVTGYGQPHDRERTQKAGFDDHLVKPVDLPALRRAFSVTGPLADSRTIADFSALAASSSPTGSAAAEST